MKVRVCSPKPNLQTCKKSRSSVFILANRKWRTFYLKDDNGKLWVETIIVTFLDVVATVDVLTASYNDVLKTCRNSKRIFCMTIKSSSRLERINKLEGDNSYWQILSLVCPLKYHVFRGISRSKKIYIYHVTLLSSHHS